MKLLTRKCPEAKASKYGVTLYVSDNDHFMHERAKRTQIAHLSNSNKQMSKTINMLTHSFTKCSR